MYDLREPTALSFPTVVTVPDAGDSGNRRDFFVWQAASPLAMRTQWIKADLARKTVDNTWINASQWLLDGGSVLVGGVKAVEFELPTVPSFNRDVNLARSRLTGTAQVYAGFSLGYAGGVSVTSTAAASTCTTPLILPKNASITQVLVSTYQTSGTTLQCNLYKYNGDSNGAVQIGTANQVNASPTSPSVGLVTMSSGLPITLADAEIAYVVVIWPAGTNVANRLNGIRVTYTTNKLSRF